MHSIAFYSHKGGTGKTFQALQRARTEVANGKRVLFLDLDPQMNATSSLMSGPWDFDAHMHKCLMPHEVSGFVNVQRKMFELMSFELSKTFRTDDALVSSCGVHFLPGHPDNNWMFVQQVLEENDGTGNLNYCRLVRFLIDVYRNSYDLVIVDLNPDLYVFNRCALWCCDEVIVPVTPDKYSIYALKLMAKELFPNKKRGRQLHMYDRMNSTMRVSGFIVKPEGSPDSQILTEIESEFKKLFVVN